jgi:hypothetical protein
MKPTQYSESLDSLLVDYIDEEPTLCMDRSELVFPVEAEPIVVVPEEIATEFDSSVDVSELTEHVVPSGVVLPGWLLPVFGVSALGYFTWVVFFLDNVPFFKEGL